jgi:hypothetical protein
MRSNAIVDTTTFLGEPSAKGFRKFDPKRQFDSRDAPLKKPRNEQTSTPDGCRIGTSKSKSIPLDSSEACHLNVVLVMAPYGSPG